MAQFIGGLDIGQTTDPAALAVLRKDGHGDQAVYTLGVLHRFPLRTLYPDLVRQAGAMMTRGPLAGAPLVMDQTGVGRGVVDLARETLTKTWVVPVTITSGQATTKQDNGDYHVPKKDLIGAALLLLHSGRLVFAEDLRHGPLLHKELQTFQMKITAAGNETFGAPLRQGAHDDLVLAPALACWAGEKLCCGPWDATPDPAARLEICKAPPGVFLDHGRDDDDRYDPADDDDGGSFLGPAYPSAW